MAGSTDLKGLAYEDQPGLAAGSRPSGYQLAIDLAASIDNLTGELARDRKRRNALAQAIHTFSIPPMPITISASAGSLNLPNILGPQLGNFWDIRRISVTGYTAGTVAVYINQANAELVANFITPNAGPIIGTQYFGTGNIMLTGNDALYFNATGITAASGFLTVSVAGVEIAAPFIGEYLL